MPFRHDEEAFERRLSNIETRLSHIDNRVVVLEGLKSRKSKRATRETVAIAQSRHVAFVVVVIVLSLIGLTMRACDGTYEGTRQCVQICGEHGVDRVIPDGVGSVNCFCNRPPKDES